MRLIAAFLFMVAGPIFGQDGQRKAKFEVASIKRAEPLNADNASKVGMTVTDLSVTMIGAPLGILIREAYGVGPTQIVAPDFIISNRFDVMAKIPAGVGKDKVPEMLQELLRERFGFRAHEEMRSVRGYNLTVQNPDLLNKSKLTDAALQNPASGGRGGLSFTEQPGEGRKA